MVEKQIETVKKQNITIIAGFDRTWEDVVQDWNASTEVYEATNITGATLTMTIVDNQGVTFKTYTNGAGITITTPADGEYEVEFLATDTVIANRGVYTYQIECVLSGGTKYPILEGLLHIV